MVHGAVRQPQQGQCAASRAGFIIFLCLELVIHPCSRVCCVLALYVSAADSVQEVSLLSQYSLCMLMYTYLLFIGDGCETKWGPLSSGRLFD